MHTASYEFLMKPKESAGCHQTLSARVGSGDETKLREELQWAGYYLSVHSARASCASINSE